MDYKERFKDPRWQKKRLEILDRDDWKCRSCLSKDETLNVHHMTYDNDIENPWEYDNGNLITLCDYCHKLTHKQPYYIPFIEFPGVLSSGLLNDDILWDIWNRWSDLGCGSFHAYWGPLI